MKITVYANEILTVEYNEKKLISDILKELGISFSLPCGGNHTCGKCRVKVSGKVSKTTPAEKALLNENDENIRLACFTYAEGDCEIHLSENSAFIQTKGIKSRFTPDSCNCGIGFAVDIGTTTVAVYGYDLKSGKELLRDAFLNPQSIYGGDVISRVGAAISGNDNKLSSLIVSSISDSFKKLCNRNAIPLSDIRSAVITGNTAMLYLLSKKNVACLAAAPFEITDYLGVSISASELGFIDFPKLTVYFPRTISAFVGSDITCSLLSCTDLTEKAKVSVMVDIGTNGEMAIVKADKLFCCSTAAGPAFEGAGITFGCMAKSGAINKVSAINGTLSYSTISGEKAVGLCGSGLIDAVATFIDLGLIDDTGCIGDEIESPYITEYNGQVSLKIADSGILLTQSDIRSLQLAKSAIRSGIDSLINAVGICENEIDRLLLAGGFGSYINVESAAKIGLIPKTFAKKATAIGNAAGMGAVAMLLSEKAKFHGEKLAKSAVTLELSTSAFFMERYVENMLFL